MSFVNQHKHTGRFVGDSSSSVGERQERLKEWDVYRPKPTATREKILNLETGRLSKEGLGPGSGEVGPGNQGPRRNEQPSFKTSKSERSLEKSSDVIQKGSLGGSGTFCKITLVS